MPKHIPINEDTIINILSNNFGFEKINLPVVGTVIKMNPRDALIYSILTSHGYLDSAEPNQLYRLTRDNFRVFNQACEYNFQEGIFSLSDGSFASTLNTEVLKKPYISNGDKFILPLQNTGYNKFQRSLKGIITELENKGINPNDIIVCPLRVNGKITVELEPFFEYVVSNYFGLKGMLTDTQIPFFYGVGTPDVAAYSIPSFLSVLREYGFLSKGGSFIDLMSVAIFGRRKDYTNFNQDVEAIVCEVKTGQLKAPQILKYTNTGLFNRCYEVIPCEKEPEVYAGLLTIDTEGKLIILQNPEPTYFEKEKQVKYLEWIEQYAKVYLLANLTTDQLESLLIKKGYSVDFNDLKKYIISESPKKVIFEVANLLGDKV